MSANQSKPPDLKDTSDSPAEEPKETESQVNAESSNPENTSQASSDPNVESEKKEEQESTEEEKNLVKKFPSVKKSEIIKKAALVLLIIFAGIASGYGLSVAQSGNQQLKSTEEVSEEEMSVGDVFGLQDEKTFRDQAQGVLVKGGIEGEGSHHLLRPGGESQNVYLTSSTVDLDLFVDHKVKVWGETFSAQKAGWLMDVGRVEVIELNSQKPFETE